MARKSDVTYWKLMQAGLTRGTAATVGPRRNKSPASRTNALDGEVVTDIPREEDTRHRPLLGSVRNPGKLKLVISNKDWRARPKASNARLGARQPLVLVWSDGHLVTAGRSRTRRP